jgi:hypothetical protein
MTPTTFTVGQSVTTEWGPGTVAEITGRSVTIALAEGEFANKINVQYGTPGYRRLTDANDKALTAS